MSDILIRGMEMPEDGSCIQIVIDDDGNVYPTVEKCIMKIGSIATAVHIPPHGKCIDANAFLMLCKDYAITPSDDEFCKRLEYALTKAATIIPADSAEEDE